jgi:hypothetical protein
MVAVASLAACGIAAYLAFALTNNASGPFGL